MSERSHPVQTMSTPRIKRCAVHALRATALLASLLLAGCSDVPSWANPADWYKGVESVFTGSDSSSPPAPKTQEAQNATQDIRNAPIPGEGEPFPNLASVPPRPTSVTPADERKKIEEALISDRQHARYIEEPSAPRAEPLPGADVRAAPRPPVTEGGPIPPPPPAAAQTPAPSGSSGLAQAQPRRPAPPPNVPPPPAAAPAAPAAAPPASSTAGSLRSLGRLVIGPSGEVKQALPSDNGAAEQPPSPGAPPNDGTQPVAVVLFNDGATRISPQQRQGLKAVVDEANARGGTVRIVGHASPARDTNSTAGLVANYKVAWDRAQSVADALAKSGIAAERVHVEADTSPNSAPPVANLPAGDAALRRADIFLQ